MMKKNKSNPRSVMADPAKLQGLRTQLGWTQEIAASHSGYSERLIRKLETGIPVRPKTLRDVLEVYHRFLDITDWRLDGYLMQGNSEGNRDEGAPAEVLRRFFDLVYNQRRIDWVETAIAENAVLKSETGDRIGRNAFLERAEAILSGFCPIEFRIEQAYSNGSDAVICWHAKMKHAGEFLNVPASHRWVESRGASVARVLEGVIVEGEDKWDIEQLIRQLQGKELRQNP